jgi:hypothetical protein
MTTETTGGEQLSAEDTAYLAELGATGNEDSGAGETAETAARQATSRPAKPSPPRPKTSTFRSPPS